MRRNETVSLWKERRGRGAADSPARRHQTENRQTSFDKSYRPIIADPAVSAMSRSSPPLDAKKAPHRVRLICRRSPRPLRRILPCPTVVVPSGRRAAPSDPIGRVQAPESGRKYGDLATFAPDDLFTLEGAVLGSLTDTREERTLLAASIRAAGLEL